MILIKTTTETNDAIRILLPYPYNELALIEKGKRSAGTSLSVSGFKNLESYREFVENMFDPDHFMEQTTANNTRFDSVRYMLAEYFNIGFDWGMSQVHDYQNCLWRNLHFLLEKPVLTKELLIKGLYPIQSEWLNQIPPDPRYQSIVEEVLLEF